LFAELLDGCCISDTLHCIVDPYNGIADMTDGILQTVGNPDDRFEEDALRIIRALRFLTVLNINNVSTVEFDIEKETRTSLKKNFYRIGSLPKERLKIELDKVAKKGSLFAFVSFCDELNILKTLFPAVYATKHLDQPVRYHPFDVYVHTILCLYHLEQLTDNYLLKFAILYHDVGKVDQYYAYSL
jgi:tRNA nucleotidyltransferase (CCA-adding enzyme)